MPERSSEARQGRSVSSGRPLKRAAPVCNRLPQMCAPAYASIWSRSTRGHAPARGQTTASRSTRQRAREGRNWAQAGTATCLRRGATIDGGYRACARGSPGHATTTPVLIPATAPARACAGLPDVGVSPSRSRTANLSVVSPRARSPHGPRSARDRTRRRVDCKKTTSRRATGVLY